MNDLYPDLGQRGPGNVWELRERWMYTWPAEGREWRLTLVEGYAFEPSVPRVVWPVVSPLETLTASAPHDFVYRYEGRIPPSAEEGSLEVRWPGGTWTPYTEPIPRRNADRLFGRILREQEVARWRRRLAYKAVHWFGAAAWEE
jgi:hypothetical protein